MNEVFRPFLRKYVLVFFDDILVYSKTWADHLRQLRQVFTLLRAHHLFLNHSKCDIGTSKVAYLGHVISASGVKPDYRKIQAVIDWPMPQLVTALKGFLGLTGYYRKFIREYGQIVAPLNNLLKSNVFQWSDIAASSFQQLKQALASAQFYNYPTLRRLLILNVMLQGDALEPSYSNRDTPSPISVVTLPPHHHKLAMYERELIILAKAI
ncbi:uncharacterized mitochondrial protein AtMg00860-like [Aristolochia californica]|uniref:uncharacterized mitochondrial protein AtMg00860-like n=1 Tax=Aristolochia californica TaxID=171875 RepID=UPI0035D868B6